MMYRVSPSDPCPCGSGKKFHHCCKRTRKAYGITSTKPQEQQEQAVEKPSITDIDMKKLDDFIAANPSNPQGYCAKANVLFMLSEQQENPLASYQQILPFAEKALQLWNQLDQELGEELLLHYLKLTDMLITIYMHLGHYASINEVFKRAYRIDPDYINAAMLIDILENLGQKEVAEQIKEQMI